MFIEQTPGSLEAKYLTEAFDIAHDTLLASPDRVMTLRHGNDYTEDGDYFELTEIILIEPPNAKLLLDHSGMMALPATYEMVPANSPKRGYLVSFNKDSDPRPSIYFLSNTLGQYTDPYTGSLVQPDDPMFDERRKAIVDRFNAILANSDTRAVSFENGKATDRGLKLKLGETAISYLNLEFVYDSQGVFLENILRVLIAKNTKRGVQLDSFNYFPKYSEVVHNRVIGADEVDVPNMTSALKYLLKTLRQLKEIDG